MKWLRCVLFFIACFTYFAVEEVCLEKSLPMTLEEENMKKGGMTDLFFKFCIWPIQVEICRTSDVSFADSGRKVCVVSGFK